MLLLHNDNCKHTNLFQSVIKVFMDKDVRLNAENVLTKPTAVASMELVYRDVFQDTKEIRAQNVRLWFSYYILIISLFIAALVFL